MRTYLDHAATTPMLDVARQAWLDASAVVGNASSVHTSGRRARRIVEEARESIAADLRTRPSAVVFTSGGTEADNLAIKGLAWARHGAQPEGVVAASGIEHHAVLDPIEWLAKHEGMPVRWLDVDAQGRVGLDEVAAVLCTMPVALATVMWANNEVGTIQPVEAIAAMCREHGVPFHVDAVQVLGALHVDIDALGATSVAFSSHKIGGPHGVGALVVDPTATLTPLTHGGGQEREIRSGTLDVPGIAGFAAAVHEAVAQQQTHATHVRELRDALASGLLAQVPEVVINGTELGDERLPGNLHVSFPGCEGDALLLLFDAAGIDCSTGSACTAGIPEPSHVLTAMGADESVARCSLRFSLGRTSADADIEAVLAVLPSVVDRAGRVGSASSR